VLHKKSADRFATKFSDVRVVLEGLSKEAETCNAKTADISFDFLEPDESVKDGEWVPEVKFTIRRSDALKD